MFARNAVRDELSRAKDASEAPFAFKIQCQLVA